jgi:hypothetical protein
MNNEPQMPEIKFDAAGLYHEDVFTDRAAGTIRRLRPVLPLGFEIEATSLEEAMAKFPVAVQEALNQAIEEAREMRREAQSRIVMPEAGMPGGIPGGGRIKL